MKIFLLIFVLIIGLSFSFNQTLAQKSLISVQTDDNNYDESDTIVISGMVTTVIGENPVTLQLFSGEEYLH